MMLIRPRNYRPPAARVAVPPQTEPVSPPLVPPPLAPPTPAQTAASTPLASQTPPAPPTAPPTPDIQSIAGFLQEALGDRYEILKPVAIGGMATLFQMRHRFHGALCVAKILHAHLADRPEIVEAFLREACHVARLADHPNVVPVIDLLLVRGRPCLVMPYIEGEDLDRLLGRVGKLPREEALMLVAQLASLLMWAERHGITHCDLAPGNIRLDCFGQYRVLDFGLSRSAGSAEEEAEQAPLPVAGTPAYNSPEQLRGEPLDIRADLYAVGVILFEVLTGRPLFEADTLEELAELHLRGDWQLPSEFEADLALARLLRTLVVADREQRMSSAFELASAVAAFGFELPSFARSLSHGPPLPPRPRRSRLEAA